MQFDNFLNRIFLLASLILLTVSCSDYDQYHEPIFNEEENANFEIITDDFYFGLVNDIWEYQSYLLVLAYDIQTHKTLHIYDKDSGKLIYSGIEEGRGPGETLYGYKNVSFENGIMTYFDIVKQSILSFSVDSLLSGYYVFTDSTKTFPTWSRFVSKIGDDFLFIRNIGYSTADTSIVKRFLITTNKGEVISQSDLYPIADRAERFTIYNYPYIAISPDESKMAIGTSLGAILETYSLNNEVQLINTQYFVKPIFQITQASYDFKENSIMGFNDVFATDDQIITAFDGEVRLFYNKSKDIKSKKILFSKIATFDWNGKPNKLIRTNMRIEKLCYNATDNIVYAAVENKEGMTFLAKLKLQ